MAWAAKTFHKKHCVPGSVVGMSSVLLLHSSSTPGKRGPVLLLLCSHPHHFSIEFIHLGLGISSEKEYSWTPKGKSNTPNGRKTVIAVLDCLVAQNEADASAETTSKWQAKIWKGEKMWLTLKNISLLCTVLWQVLSASIIFIIWSTYGTMTAFCKEFLSKVSVTATVTSDASVGGIRGAVFKDFTGINVQPKVRKQAD